MTTCLRLKNDFVEWSESLLHHHTDLISSVGILAVTTASLASKIFEKTSGFVSQASFFVLNFGGVIWVNLQVRDLWKSFEDLKRSLGVGVGGLDLLLTATKIFVKTANIFLTCGLFAAAAVPLCGYPLLAPTMYVWMRPLAILTFSLGIGCDVADYSLNRNLLRELKPLPADSAKVKATMHEFRRFLTYSNRSRGSEEKKLAAKIIRQIQTPVFETFQEILNDPNRTQPTFHDVKDAVQDRQTATESNLFLLTLGYFSMGICRIFPATLADLSVRWMMSVFYTDELIRQKLFQYDLKNHAENG